MPTLADEVAFISGVSPDGTLPLNAFGAWNNDNPATYTGGYTNSAKWGANTAGTAGGAVRYYFDAASNWTSTEQQMLSAGLDLWSAVANISFVLTTSAAQAQVSFVRGTTGKASTSESYSGNSSAGRTGGTTLYNLTAATVSIDTTAPGFGPIDGSFTTKGGYPVMTLLHEEGHALGLGHAGPYNSTVDPATQQFSQYDTRQFSIMSYIEPRTTSAKYFSQYPVTGTNWGNNGAGSSNEPTTWMPADILAVQALYGLPVSTPLSGGQTFGFNCNIAGDIEPFFDFTKNTKPVVTLWDIGANNTLDLSGFSASATVNLFAGGFSSCNGQVNNIAIAYNTAINTLVCGNGANTVMANNDGDTLYGGASSNTLSGGTGNDYEQGGAGNDYLDGGGGNDVASYANAASGVNVDLSLTGPQNTSGAGTDQLVNIEYLIGSGFADTLKGDGVHSAYLAGGAGNDYLQSGAGDDYLDGGAGYDLASYSNAASGVNVDLSLAGPQNTGGAGTDQLVNIEYLLGSGFADTLKGDGVHSAYLAGGAGNDYIQGGASDDYLDGGPGYDLASYANAASGVTVDLSLAGPQNTGGAGTDQLVNIEYLLGSGFADTLKGDGVNSAYLAGGAGNDYLQGGAGNDYLDGGLGYDLASYANAASGVTVDLSLAGPQNTGGAGTDQLVNIEYLLGSAFSDTLRSDGVHSAYLAGGAGNDTLQGGAGDDYLDGGTGADTLTGGGGNNLFAFTKGAGIDTVTDFSPGNASGDVISLAGYGINSFQDLQSHMSQSGADMVLTFDSLNQITMKNVLIGQVNSGDFLFR